jgi:HEAT repeat protein
MRCGPTLPGMRSGVGARPWSVTLAAVVIAGAILAANGDILHLKNGGSVEGSIIEHDGQSYRVRTIVGTVTLPVDAVDHVEKKPSILDEYVKRREEAADTPAAQVELAKWCDEQGLKAGWRTHLKRAIELDPDCEAARVALGFVRVAGIWVDGRTVADRPESVADKKEADEPDDAGNADEKVVAAIQTQWTVQIRAIKKNFLETSVGRLQRRGRERIVAIQDPLAILPLARLLSDGNWACRDALVEVLSHFPQDEATMNLAVLALVDDNEGIRRRALAELKRREDRRVIPQLRQALVSDNDTLIRRAAISLGMLEATSAIPDLIDMLKAQRRKLVEVSTRTYFRDYQVVFDSPTIVSLGNVSQIRHAPVLGIASIGLGLVSVQHEYQMRDVTVFRTEVREALRKITGEDFGFDEAAWRRWYRERQP